MPASDPDLPPDQAATQPAGAECTPDMGSCLRIDLGAIAANWRTLTSRATPVECAAVVKADAYGCGIEPVTRVLAAAGCNTFFVADLIEARRVRSIAPEAAIYVLNGLLPGTPSAYAEIYARPVIGSLVEFAEWDTFCAARGWHGGAALHVDTGMNRLGINPQEAAALGARVAQTERHGVTLLMSHLACADVPEHPLNDRQIRLFREVRSHFRGISASLANSSGVFLADSTHCDMVRPGLALYGANPTPCRTNPMRPVVELTARVVQIRSVARGEPLGYGAAWTASQLTRVAIVAAGYADGYARANGAVDGGAGAEALVAGRRCPVVGRVSMDLLAVDITDLPEQTAHRGDWVTLIGGEITLDEVAAIGGLISYEMLTGLGRRHTRLYIEPQADAKPDDTPTLRSRRARRAR
ncbi:MAG: alanine racemase [Rhizobiales bacterium]|nr:alanine racemase [Hyphomicrobiales bacterium]